MAYFEDLEVGQAAEASHLIDAPQIEAFGHAVGDLNPVHFDEEYAATTPFGGRIAHGMLAGGYISALIASRLPGPGSIYNSQTLDFLRAVRIGDELVVRASGGCVVGEVVDRSAHERASSFSVRARPETGVTRRPARSLRRW